MFMLELRVPVEVYLVPDIEKGAVLLDLRGKKMPAALSLAHYLERNFNLNSREGGGLDKHLQFKG